MAYQYPPPGGGRGVTGPPPSRPSKPATMMSAPTFPINHPPGRPSAGPPQHAPQHPPLRMFSAPVSSHPPPPQKPSKPSHLLASTADILPPDLNYSPPTHHVPPSRPPKSSYHQHPSPPPSSSSSSFPVSSAPPPRPAVAAPSTPPLERRGSATSTSTLPGSAHAQLPGAPSTISTAPPAGAPPPIMAAPPSRPPKPNMKQMGNAARFASTLYNNNRSDSGGGGGGGNSPPTPTMNQMGGAAKMAGSLYKRGSSGSVGDGDGGGSGGGAAAASLAKGVHGAYTSDNPPPKPTRKQMGSAAKLAGSLYKRGSSDNVGGDGGGGGKGAMTASLAKGVHGAYTSDNPPPKPSMKQVGSAAKLAGSLYKRGSSDNGDSGNSDKGAMAASLAKGVHGAYTSDNPPPKPTKKQVGSAAKLAGSLYNNHQEAEENGTSGKGAMASSIAKAYTSDNPPPKPTMKQMGAAAKFAGSVYSHNGDGSGTAGDGSADGSGSSSKTSTAVNIASTLYGKKKKKEETPPPSFKDLSNAAVAANRVAQMTGSLPPGEKPKKKSFGSIVKSKVMDSSYKGRGVAAAGAGAGAGAHAGGGGSGSTPPSYSPNGAPPPRPLSPSGYSPHGTPPPRPVGAPSDTSLALVTASSSSSIIAASSSLPSFCSACGGGVPAPSRFCPTCGTGVCVACSGALPAGARFCPSCGQSSLAFSASSPSNMQLARAEPLERLESAAELIRLKGPATIPLPDGYHFELKAAVGEDYYRHPSIRVCSINAGVISPPTPPMPLKITRYNDVHVSLPDRETGEPKVYLMAACTLTVGDLLVNVPLIYDTPSVCSRPGTNLICFDNHYFLLLWPHTDECICPKDDLEYERMVEPSIKGLDSILEEVTTYQRLYDVHQRKPELTETKRSKNLDKAATTIEGGGRAFGSGIVKTASVVGLGVRRGNRAYVNNTAGVAEGEEIGVAQKELDKIESRKKTSEKVQKGTGKVVSGIDKGCGFVGGGIAKGYKWGSSSYDKTDYAKARAQKERLKGPPKANNQSWIGVGKASISAVGSVVSGAKQGGMAVCSDVRDGAVTRAHHFKGSEAAHATYENYDTAGHVGLAGAQGLSIYTYVTYSGYIELGCKVGYKVGVQAAKYDMNKKNVLFGGMWKKSFCTLRTGAMEGFRGFFLVLRNFTLAWYRHPNDPWNNPAGYINLATVRRVRKVTEKLSHLMPNSFEVTLKNEIHYFSLEVPDMMDWDEQKGKIDFEAELDSWVSHIQCVCAIHPKEV